jgi:hypothetical protein
MAALTLRDIGSAGTEQDVSHKLVRRGVICNRPSSASTEFASGKPALEGTTGSRPVQPGCFQGLSSRIDHSPPEGRHAVPCSACLSISVVMLDRKARQTSSSRRKGPPTGVKRPAGLAFGIVPADRRAIALRIESQRHGTGGAAHVFGPEMVRQLELAGAGSGWRTGKARSGRRGGTGRRCCGCDRAGRENGGFGSDLPTSENMGRLNEHAELASPTAASTEKRAMKGVCKPARKPYIPSPLFWPHTSALNSSTQLNRTD